MTEPRLWVARVTRHALLERQRAELQALFGDNVGIVPFEITHHANLERAVEDFDFMLSGHHYVAAEVIASPRMMARLLDSKTMQSGTILMRPVLMRIPGGGSVEGTRYRFSHYERVLEMHTVTERLIPPYILPETLASCGASSD